MKKYPDISGKVLLKDFAKFLDTFQIQIPTKDPEIFLHGYRVKIEKTNYDDGDLDVVLFWHAEIEELKGLEVYGDTLDEVMADIQTAYVDWVEAQHEWGREIPKPRRSI